MLPKVHWLHFPVSTTLQHLFILFSDSVDIVSFVNRQGMRQLTEVSQSLLNDFVGKVQMKTVRITTVPLGEVSMITKFVNCAFEAFFFWVWLMDLLTGTDAREICVLLSSNFCLDWLLNLCFPNIRGLSNWWGNCTYLYDQN